MSNNRPQGLDFLLQDFGNTIGAADLAFDEDGLISLDLDGTEFDVEYSGKGWELIVRSQVEVAPEQVDAGFALALLTANAQSFALGDGILVYDADLEAMVAMNRIDARGMTVDQLIESIGDLVRAFRVWPERLAALPSAAADTPPDHASAHSSEVSFIRI